MLGLDDGWVVRLVRQRNREDGLLDPLAERLGVVGEVVEDAHLPPQIEPPRAFAARAP